MVRNQLNILMCLLLILTIIGCKGQDSGGVQEIKIIKKDTFEFNLNDIDSVNSFGLPKQSEFEIGPISPFIVEKDIYLIDNYFNRVKKINYLGALESTEELDSYRKILWLNDISLKDEMLYVLSDFNTIYVLRKNLELVKKIIIPNYESGGYTRNKKFLTRDTLIYHDLSKDKYFLIKDDSVVEFRNEVNTVESYLNSEYALDDTRTIVNTKFGTLKLSEPVQDITMDFYQCNNLTFTESMLVHFKISSDRKKITFYRYEY